MLKSVGRVFLSTGLILVSAAYAIWQQRPQPETPIASQLPPPRAKPPPSPRSKLPLAQFVPPVAGPHVFIVASAPPAAPKDQASVRIVPDIVAAPSVANTAPQARLHRYADGKFIGDSVDTEWGDVQVEAAIRGGILADITCIAFPNHRRRSEQISTWAIPMLKQEAIQSQSADIDLVSQASFTSDGYQKSLASALAKARD